MSISDNDALSASVTLKTDPGKGRYTVASEDIKIGSIIASEEPTAFILNPDDSSLILEFCHNCLRQISMSFVPCEGCTSVIFCSKDCRKSAMSKTHRFECELDLYGMRSRSNASSFRIFLALQAILQYPIEEIDNIQKSPLMKMVAHEQIRIFEVEMKNLAITILILVLLHSTVELNQTVQFSAIHRLSYMEGPSYEIKMGEMKHNILLVGEKEVGG